MWGGGGGGGGALTDRFLSILSTLSGCMFVSLTLMTVMLKTSPHLCAFRVVICGHCCQLFAAHLKATVGKINKHLMCCLLVRQNRKWRLKSHYSRISSSVSLSFRIYVHASMLAMIMQVYHLLK